MSPTRVAIVCPECGTRVEVGPHEIATKLTQHNTLQHDGAPVASIAGGHVDRLTVGVSGSQHGGR